ncbi:MAG TPA: MMPL family transporter [Solirubrobacteraceae bacterium]|jgi:RND superfamily putative drug exporter|nr:MMPL family transporter [Solirubrobacteraceae bacterium]
MGAVFELASRRRAKWVLVAAWLIAAAAAGSVAGRFQSSQRNDTTSYLPGDAESSQVIDAIKAAGGGSEITQTVVVFARDAAKLSPADVGVIAADRASMAAELPRGTLGPAAPVRSRDGEAALLDLGLRLHGSTKALDHDVSLIKRIVHASAPAGLAAKVTGPGGVSYDASQVFKSINSKLLLVTVSLVFALLILIYRSPIFWAIPLLSVGAAEAIAEGLGYVLTQFGVTINSQSAGILTVLVFGTGTDYALLLVARYREELRRHESRGDAMRIALRRAGPVIFASAMTVILALLCVLSAEVNSTRGLGPISAIGVALAMLATLTFLPALLLIAGRRAFWPFIPRVGSSGADETHGPWRRVADRVGRRHRAIATATIAVLAVLCIGLTSLDTNLSGSDAFTGVVESQVGQQLLGRHFPAGESSPLQIVVPSKAHVAAVREAVARAPGVSRASGALSATIVSSVTGAAIFTAALSVNPTSQYAMSLIAPIRRIAKAAGGAGVLVGGATAQQRDLHVAAARDDRVVVPLILIVVMVVLGLLLRSIVAPVLLVATVIFSYAAALGAGAFVFSHILGYAGEDPSLILFSFLFLVALGCDYNIFLMARAREESASGDTRRGVLRALSVTGAVITSAGIVLAGTFSALASLPLVAFAEVGLVIAFGVLLDTFLVRTVLVPALVLEIEGRVWWPSALSRGRAGAR